MGKEDNEVVVLCLHHFGLVHLLVVGSAVEVCIHLAVIVAVQGFVTRLATEAALVKSLQQVSIGK